MPHTRPHTQTHTHARMHARMQMCVHSKCTCSFLLQSLIMWFYMQVLPVPSTFLIMLF